MPKKLNPSELKSLIADHKTGKYSQRQLSRKYGMSVGYINKNIKNIEKTDEELVNTGIRYKSELACKDEHAVNAIEHAVNEAAKHLIFFNNSALKNQSIANSKLNIEMHIAEIESHSRITARNRNTVLGKPADLIENPNLQKDGSKASQVTDVLKELANRLPD